jgi:hypothetical protein
MSPFRSLLTFEAGCPGAGWEMGRARLMTTLTSSPACPIRCCIQAMLGRTDRSDTDRLLRFVLALVHVDDLGQHGARVVNDLGLSAGYFVAGEGGGWDSGRRGSLTHIDDRFQAQHVDSYRSVLLEVVATAWWVCMICTEINGRRGAIRSEIEIAKRKSGSNLPR